MPGPRSKFTILPVPFEATTCYGKGTKNGPAAILAALPQVEEFDVATQKDLRLSGIKILPPLPVKKARRLPEKLINGAVKEILSQGRFPVVLGGEHSISASVVLAVRNKYPDLSILHFDAHADLRDKYHGRKDSHACAARRILEICPNLVQVGVRSLSREEYDFAKGNGQISKIHFAHKKIDLSKILRQLSKNVYVTFDVDVLDPSEMPATGTPEPGGLDYNQTVEIVRAVAAKKKIVGLDIVELSPIPGLHAPNYLAARLLHQILAMLA